MRRDTLLLVKTDIVVSQSHQLGQDREEESGSGHIGHYLGHNGYDDTHTQSNDWSWENMK